MKSLWLTVMVLFMVFTSKAQQDSTRKFNTNTTEQVPQDILEDQATDADDESVGDSYDGEISDGELLSVNDADEQTLVASGLFTPLQAASLVWYREKHGPLVSFYEMAWVPLFTVEQVMKVMPFLSLAYHPDLHVPSLAKQLAKSRRQVLMRWSRQLELPKGYTVPQAKDTARYAGSIDKVMLKFGMHYRRNLSVNLLMEKDPGEAFFGKGSRAGFDFYSGHVAFRAQKPWLPMVVIGDYTVRLGQGLIGWNGFSLSRADVLRNGDGLHPYSSTGEEKFFRGVGITLKPWQRVSVTGFVSSHAIDVSSWGADSTVQRLGTSGLHRTAAEINGKGRVEQRSAGGRVFYHGRYLRVGLNGMYTHYSLPIHPQAVLYQKYAFSGQQVANVSVDYSFFYNGWQCFGETAVSDNGGISTVHGITSFWDQSLRFTAIFREASLGFHPAQGGSSGIGSANETGLWMGTSFTMNSNTQVLASADVFRYPWLKYLVDGPSWGYSLLLDVQSTVSKDLTVKWQWRSQRKEKNRAADANGNTPALDPLVLPWKHQCRLSAEYKLNSTITLRSRIEWAGQYEQQLSRAYLISQDVLYHPYQSRWSGYARVAVIDADTGVRIYAYENSVGFALSTPAYTGRALHAYVGGQYALRDWLQLWFRIGRTLTDDPQGFGTGMDATGSLSKTDFTLQLRCKL